MQKNTNKRKGKKTLIGLSLMLKKQVFKKPISVSLSPGLDLRGGWNEAVNGWDWKFIKNKYCTIVFAVMIIIVYHAACSQNANVYKLLI